jgi:hypothetical protein
MKLIMKKLPLILVLSVSVIMIAGCQGPVFTTTTTTTLPGGIDYKYWIGQDMSGDRAIFYYHEGVYQPETTVDSVTVAGEFNGWDPASPDWHMTRQTDPDIWRFDATIDLASGIQFNYVVNNSAWQPPPFEYVEEKYVTDDGFGGFNLVLNP